MIIESFEPYFYDIDDWHDYIRLLIVTIGVVILGGLLHRFYQHRNDWNVKTKDYWYAFFMWSMAAISFGSEGIIRDRPIGPTLVFMFFGSLATLKALLKKGSWGGN